MSHPLHTHRIRGPCDTCWEQAQRRLATLEDTAVVETHQTFIAKAKRDKVIFEGKRPRTLRLVAQREAEKAAAMQNLDAPTSPEPAKENATTMDYMRGLWEQSKAMAASVKSPDSLRGKEGFEIDVIASNKHLSLDNPDSSFVIATEAEPG